MLEEREDYAGRRVAINHGEGIKIKGVEETKNKIFKCEVALNNAFSFFNFGRELYLCVTLGTLQHLLTDALTKLPIQINKNSF